MPLLVPPAPAPALMSVLAALSSPTAVREPGPRRCVLPRGHWTPNTAPRPCVRAGQGHRWTAAGAADRLAVPYPGGGPGRGGGRDVATPDGWVFSRFSRAPTCCPPSGRCGRRRHCRPRISPTCCRCGLYMLACGCTATRGRTRSPPSPIPRPADPAGSGAARDHLAPGAPAGGAGAGAQHAAGAVTARRVGRLKRPDRTCPSPFTVPPRPPRCGGTSMYTVRGSRTTYVR